MIIQKMFIIKYVWNVVKHKPGRQII